ncbi:putative membrane protein YphA (DoxX/SURF4 family) [Algoriphagus iocasae]|uniref:Putative membrane protein YphA (DoxX/SURF4 family) n=1 Tax=Algoriphagus iocasae TaxID=1836499 RepID=A0A841N3Z0_9BACT|nr:MauE/DoxX family redox-associated membrane protein [Algoriphagus iocasae]MBB6328861.1 putative membrane protein YphA (DoxX/SURF4 family) [Algoriphagus iocasae]
MRPKMKKHIMDKIASKLLILLWTYTGLDKLIQFEASRKAFHNQTFPAELAEVLAYVIPISELLIALLLLFSVLCPGHLQAYSYPVSASESEREL